MLVTALEEDRLGDGRQLSGIEPHDAPARKKRGLVYLLAAAGVAQNENRRRRSHHANPFKVCLARDHDDIRAVEPTAEIGVAGKLTCKFAFTANYTYLFTHEFS